MVSKNNIQLKDRYATKQVPHYGIRKLSVGVASVLLSTTLYMGVTAHADTIAEVNPQPTIDQPASTATGNATGSVQLKPTADQSESTTTNSPVSENGANTQSVSAVLPKQPANVVDTQSAAAASGAQSSDNSAAPKNDVSVPSAPAALPKQPSNVAAGAQPFMNLAVASDNNELAPRRETVDSTWIIHYVNQADHKQELKDPTVITLQYTRTNTPQSDGTTKYGDWSYLPGSYKQTGTQITVNDSNNPVKQDNIDKDGENMDSFTITAMYPTITGYTMHNNINGTRLHDYLRNNERQANSMSKDFYAEYDVAKERSVSVKFVDDQSFDPDSSDGKTQVGQAITLTGRDGDTVKVNVTVPDKYQLANGQQLLTTYTFTNGSGDVTIHLVHKVVQREATVNVKLVMMTGVDIQGVDVDVTRETIAQERWEQMVDKVSITGPGAIYEILPSVEVGTLTGHVNYDVVDNSVVSLGDDWTALNLGGRIYQLPNGTDVVNGVLTDSDDGSLGKPLREYYLTHYSIFNSGHSVDPDYATRPWHGYLSVKATNDPNSPVSEWNDLGLQGGLAGNEPNALAKANGDRAATSVKMTNKPIEASVLNPDIFREQDGRLQATLPVPVVGVYVPYVEKTATRTINVTNPDGKTIAVKQTATLAKQVDFGKDAHPAWTTGEWANYDVPAIPGYTASQSQIAKTVVTGTTEDQTVNITYTANSQTSTVVYQTEDGTPVHTTTVNGHTGQTVKVLNEVPVGWKIINGKVPSEITFGPNGTSKTVVTIAHSHATVTPDAPKTTSDKLPDNSGKTYPAGVSHDDLNKTVIRTIKVTTPDGQTKTITQTAKLTRTADVDEVTGEVKYSDWTTGNWSAYAAPDVPGYTASQSHVAQQAVTDATKDQTIDIIYTANDHQISVEYVDNATGQVLKTDHVSGKTGQTVSITPHAPDGWELVSGQSVPSEVTLGADGAPVTVIKVQPQERSVAIKFVDDQSDERQVGQTITLTGRDGGTSNLNLTVPDKYQLADGQQLPTTYTFKKGSGDVTIHLAHKVVQREATVDVQLGLVTVIDIDDYPLLAVTQTRWKQLDDEIKDSEDFNSDKVFPSVEVGTLTGHVGYDLVDNQVVSFNDDWTSLNLGGQTYQMPDGTEVVNGMVIDSRSSWGKTLKEQYLKYYPDPDLDYVNQAWHGYLSANKTNEMAPGFIRNELQAGLVGNEPNKLAKVIGDQAATAVKIANKTIDSNWLKGNFDTSEFSEQNGRLQGSAEFDVVGVYIPYVEKTATRTIKVTTPDGKTTTVEQTATLAKRVAFQKDNAHSDWTTGEWTSYDVPTIPGYTASQLNVAKETVTGATNDQTVNITYTANPQTATVVYQTEDGTPVHTTTVNGHTGQTVKVSNEVPVGWHVVNGKVPSEITFGPNGTSKTVVTIAHSHATVAPDAPKTTSDKLPDNPGKTYPAGVGETDLNKTATGTIKVTMPDGQIKTVVKTAHLTRTADVDEVTGEVKYSDWTTGYWSDYTAPSVPGYTADYPYIAGQSVDGETEDQTIEITYTANPQTTHVNYVDTQGKLVHTITVNGQTDQTVKVPSEIPDGWKLVDGQTVPNTITFGPDGHADTSVKIEHKYVTVDPDRPQTNGTKLPDNPKQSFHGVEASDLNKTVIRRIKVTTPDGQTKTVAQTVKLTRTATVDEVTGDVTYSNWSTGQWAKYDVPAVNGYTSTQTEVAAVSVNEHTTDQTVNVTYTPDAQKLNVKFIDDTTGQVLKTVAKTGVTNANTGYNTKSDIQSYESQHYVLVSDSSNGSNLVFDNNDNADQAYEVHLKHGTHQIDEHHTITQTVYYTATDHAGVPDDHTVSVQFDRDGYHDEVTGVDHWNAWKQGGTQTFAEVPTPKKAGYTPDKSSVPATVVHPSDHNQTITVTYTPDTQKMIVTFIDDTDGGKTLKTVTKTGLTNSNVDYTTGDDINMYKGQHYVLVSDQTHGQNIIFDTDTNTDQRYEVHLKHGIHQINDHRTVTETVHYKMTDGTTAPADYTVKAEFSRDGFNDEVTGVDHWNAWTPSATHQFDAVHSLAVKGYTSDAGHIAAVTVNPDSQNIDRTVTYSPDVQKLDVTFIDDTAGTTLKTVVKNGVTHADAKYNTKSDIQNFESQHYVLVSDSSKGAALVFDNDDAVDQHYVVHLKHNTHAISEHHTVNETVHYKMSDGTKAPADYHAKALSFSRDGFNDEVTGIDHWNAWIPNAEQTFDKVASPLVAGYTPDSDQINAQTVKPTDHDLEFTVTYASNVQIAHVKYIDDTDHKVLTQDDLTGRTGETSGYHTADRITEFKGQHYDLVSDNYPTDGMTFDNNDHADQIYEVHFKHAARTDEQDVQVPRTIKYVYQSGQPAQPDHTDALKFHETKVVDLVDGHTVSDDWTPTQDFKTIETPAIQGYTPDHTSISNTGITHDHSAIVETVTYNPDAQKAVVKYIDDTTGKQLEAKDLTGVSDQSTGYTTKSTIDGYVNKHYVLVSDGTHGETVVFDHDDDADQAYEVHLKHGTESANESRIKKITVHYQYADGLVRSGKAADDKTATNLTFKRTGTHDLVTDKIAWNAWDHADQTFLPIDSPAIQGYTPDRTVVDNIKVNPDSHDLTEITVTYNADSQKLSVDFIDDTTGKTLKTVTKTGYSDESADYNTKSDVQDFISKHYDLNSDQTNGENLVFDHDDNINQHYEVHLSHHTHQINEQHTITETVHYQYADGLARSGKAADDFNANALKFSRDGFNDEVTGIDHWNAWTPADQQTFAAVQSPVIEGYTPDQSKISAINVVPTSQSIEKTVIYTADAQKLTVNFIDDVTGQILKTVVKTGYSDESAGYNTKADIQNFVGRHYDLVSDATHGANLVFDHDNSVDQAYDVHLTHHLTPISDHQVVNGTIHYVYADGLARTGKAADDYTATPLEFNRTGKHDDVTGTDAWDAWTPGSANFVAVQSPAIQGYTPDQAQIDMISVNANSQDVVKTVTYSADPQTVTIDFIDDANHGKVLKTVTKTGGSDEAVGYNTKADIQTFVDGHYKLDHDTSNGANLVFDHDDAVDQHYEVHLTHETAPISEATSTNQVIHYQLANGTPVAKDYTAKVDFSRDGFKDLVTNADHWNAWTPNATQTFNTVKSPAKAGYTPDHAQVDAVTVEPHHANLETTVTYSPDAQKAAVKYIDDVTGKTLQTKELTGVSDETSTYTTASTIKQYVGQHYKLVSDQTNGKPVVFDHDDDNYQILEVHLTHTYQEVSQEHQVHQTIHYQYADGKQVQPDYTATALAFSRTGTQDLVTEDIQWNAWTPDQVFAAVDTPAVNGYTPDVQTVAPVKVSHDSKDIEQTVIYHADDQTILVNYIDDETHSTLKTDSIIGKTAQTSDYTTKKSLDQYKGQHYDVVSDDTNGDTLKFDSDSTKVQTYNVHLKHQHQAASDKATVHQTVHYVYQDGKQAAKDHTATPIEFTRTGDTDLVTGQTTWNDWTPATGTFVAVLSPTISGYTPSRAMINHVTVHPGDKDIDTTVTYVPDRQMIVVNYIDQVTGKTLKTDALNGHSDQTSGYTTKSQIDSYMGQHYKLISDDTNGRTLTFDHDDQATQIYDVVLGHQTEAAHRTHEVHEIIDYVYTDGSQVAKSFTAQPIVFSQNGVHDLVTNTINWNGDWTHSQEFAAVESPKIIGFTASKPEVKAVEVNHESGDVHELVIYAANTQTAQIKYIDDVTGNVLEVDGANGHFNESIVFGHNVNDQINKFKQAHYKLVSNNFAGQKYQADNAKNVYEVHLTHERQNVHATDTVTETVKFQYADGSQAQPTKTQTVNFSRDGIKDLVTGATAWMPVDPQTIGAVDVPAINGYTADIDQVPAVKVNFGDKDITKVVTYIANDQNAGIKIIDDTTGKVLNTQVANGKFGTEIQFKQNPDQQVIDLQAQHYELVSDNFKHQNYQADNAKNQFEIHVRHQMMDVQRTDTVTETIHYLGPDGNKLVSDKTQTITFTQHGVKDQVTGQIEWNSVEPQEFNAVKSPVINGYQADIAVVEGRQVLFGDQDVVVNVHYTKLPEQQPGKQPGIDMVNTDKVTPEKVVTVANGTVQETKQDGIKNSGQSNMQDTKQLPQTGNDNRAGLLSLIGSSLMVSLAIFGLSKKKKHEN